MFSLLKLEKLILFQILKARDLSRKMRRKISRRSVALAPSETAWGSSYDLFCVFNVHLCGPCLACLAGAKFFTIFNVYLCGRSLACLTGTKFLMIFNVYLCGLSLACLAGATKNVHGFQCLPVRTPPSMPCRGKIFHDF